jgi:hypothetical protein
MSAPDIQDLRDQLDAAERDARLLAEDLAEELAAWHAEFGSWGVAQCLDHLARTNRVYLRAMEHSAIRARAQGRFSRGPATPGIVGRWFVRTIEPPVKPPFTIKAPQSIQPTAAPLLADALASFASSQNEVRGFLDAYADLDLARIRFRNPFIHGIQFSVASGLHIVTAHERRHLWQAWRARRAADTAAS